MTPRDAQIAALLRSAAVRGDPRDLQAEARALLDAAEAAGRAAALASVAALVQTGVDAVGRELETLRYRHGYDDAVGFARDVERARAAARLLDELAAELRAPGGGLATRWLAVVRGEDGV